MTQPSPELRLLIPGFFTWLVVALLVAGIGSPDRCQGQIQSSEDLFETHIRPTLITKCLSCHGAAVQEGGLRLDTREHLLKGGDSGPAVVAGAPDKSLLLEALNYESLEMPPEAPLTQEQVDVFRQWIAAELPWPATEPLRPGRRPFSEEDRELWCFQPIQQAKLPHVSDPDWCKNEIDFFVLAKLEANELSPAPQASARQLHRRLHYAITGLPPTRPLSETESFSPALQIDQLLESPAYGENQARYWLDLVRYADSDGYRADHDRPAASLYRDYVIRSFQTDRPYDQFLTQQLAGDETEPDNREAIIATMYLRHWIYEHNQRDVEGQWQQILDDVTETTADAFLALGLKCARCHDHKFDPLLQRDYYRLKAFFTPLLPREDQPVATVHQQADYRKQLYQWELATHEIRQALLEIEREALLNHATREGFEKFVPEIQAMVLTDTKNRSPYEHQIASMARRQYDLLPEKLPEWLPETTEKRRQFLRSQLAEFDHLKPTPLPTQTFSVSDVSRIAPPTWMPGSDESIAPGFPSLLNSAPASIPSPDHNLETTGRRSALAEWITAPQNPLTARVIVNRIWQQHFGEGLVGNANDFGTLTDPPSHPELLDWLAYQLIQDDWSLKSLHRRILNSATYQQSSQRFIAPPGVDPGNQWLWQMRPRRLSAEEIADTLLTHSRELSQQKRTIYQPVKRNSIPSRLSLYDFPDRIRSCALRHQTTTAPQALLMMNNAWVHQRVEKIEQEFHGLSDSELINHLYQSFFCRPAESREKADGLRFLQQYQQMSPPWSPNQRVVETKVLLPATAEAAEKGAPDLVAMPGLYFTSTAPPLVAFQDPTLPTTMFTFEAIATLEDFYDDASVRSLVAHWTGKTTDAGWSLGVTSRKSAFQPGNLILQLVGNKEDGQRHYEVVASDLRVECNRPYYIAISVDLADTSENGIQFWLQDLGPGEQSLQRSNRSHQVISGIRPAHDLYLGGRKTHHFWQGAILAARLSNSERDRQGLDDWLSSATSEETVFDFRTAAQAPWFIVEKERLTPSITFQSPPNPTPKTLARRALIHTLLSSNEMIYVD